MTKTNLMKRILASVLSFAMIFGMMIGTCGVIPLSVKAELEDNLGISALSDSDRAPTLTEVTALGYSFEQVSGFMAPMTDYGIIYNGVAMKPETSISFYVLQNNNQDAKDRYFFMAAAEDGIVKVYDGSYSVVQTVGKAEPALILLKQGYGFYNTFPILPGYTQTNVQMSSPTDESMLRVDSLGRVYFPFEVLIGDKAGQTINYYLSEAGLTDDVSTASTIPGWTAPLTQLDEYPYGTAMSTNSVTLNVETTGSTYQWQMATSEDGDYTDISGATASTHTVASTAYTTRWFRCVIDGTTVTEAVQLIHASDYSYLIHKYSSAEYKWYVSNGTMAYCNDTSETEFDVLGMYDDQWISASYSGEWSVGASTKTDPVIDNAYYLDDDYKEPVESVKLTFSNADARHVLISVTLEAGAHALVIGTDTCLKLVDTCPLNAVKNSDGSLAFVQMVNASSLAAMTDNNAAMTFIPVTTASNWWCGSHGDAGRGYAWPSANQDSYSDGDSAMAVSWENLA